jgi:hypothetical protein
MIDSHQDQFGPLLSIYSGPIIKWCQSLTSIAKQILLKEVGLKVQRTRFEFQGHTYPIKISAFRDLRSHPKGQVLGQFCPNALSMTFNYDLLYFQSREFQENIIRHELAHYLCFILFGQHIQHHGKEFRELCQRFRWGPEVYRASTQIQIGQKQRKVRAKIDKLLSLGQSTNPNEAKLAIEKATRLMDSFQVNIGNESFEKETDHAPEFVVLRLDRSRRMKAIWKFIAPILDEYQALCTFHYGHGSVFFEALCPLELYQQIHEIYCFLQDSMQGQWETYRRTHGLKGATQKASFFRGFQLGMISEIRTGRKKYSKEHIQALVKANKEIEVMHTKVYGKSGTRQTQQRLDLKSQSLGIQSGKRHSHKRPRSKQVLLNLLS